MGGTFHLIYNRDGMRVKSVMDTSAGTETTYFVGAHYQVVDNGTSQTILKYYYAGSQQIAMRTNGTLNYLLGDHLGSTSLVTDATGVVISEMRYNAWGEVRYASGLSPTDYTLRQAQGTAYTGQFSYTADFGLMFYNARWYDSSLGRFAQADTIIPGGVQGLDRYAYANNSPMIYVDPSGHKACDDELGCEISGGYSGGGSSAGNGGCSVSTGGFNGSFTCTPADLNKATIAKRKSWFNSMLASVDPTLPEQFTNINGILNAFIATNSGSPGSWTSWGDTGILSSIQNGLALYMGAKDGIDQTNPYSVQSANAWNTYFRAYEGGKAPNEYLRDWGLAEHLGTEYGMLLAGEHGQSKSPGEYLFLGVGDVYRGLLLNRNSDGMTWFPKVEYEWFLDTSSTIPGTNVAPVSIVAWILLQH